MGKNTFQIIENGKVIKESSINVSDFIPIVKIDTNQIGKQNKEKSCKYEGFTIHEELNEENNQITTELYSSLDDFTVQQNLYHLVFDGTKEEIIVKFNVKQGNYNPFQDSDGFISVKSQGIKLLTNDKIFIEYGDAIEIKLSSKDIEKDACINFYADDNDEKGVYFDTTGKQNIHCGRVRVSVLPKVIVDFRPNESYDGDYGFDYMRNFENKGDRIDYDFFLSSNNYNDLIEEYETINLNWSHEEYENNNNQYIKSWLTIYPEQTVKLTLQIQTLENNSGLDLKLEYNRDIFELNTDIIPYQRRPIIRLPDDYLSIKCKKEFTEDETIKVMFGKRQLGELSVKANAKNKRKKLNVVRINVVTEIENIEIGGLKPLEETKLKNILKQAYIKVNITNTVFDLTLKNESGELKYPEFNEFYILDDITKSPSIKILNKYHKNSRTHDNLVTYMEKIFNEAKPEYQAYSKVFIFGEDGGRKDPVKIIKKLAGYSKSFDCKSVAVFKGRKITTLPHELLHSLGLQHSFKEEQTYHFMKKSTENIMDYSSKRNNTWLRQWKKLWGNKNLENE